MSDEQENILILTDEECTPCNDLKQFLAKRKDIQFININSPEAQQFIRNESKIPVPLAIKGKQFCAIEGKEDGIYLNCEGQRHQLCRMRREGDDAYLDCGDGEVKL